MKQDQLIGAENSTKQQNSLKGQIAQLKIELGDVSNKVDAFEALLRSQLTRELIETQELSVRYKAQKSEKKAKRLKQCGACWVEDTKPNTHSYPNAKCR